NRFRILPVQASAREVVIATAEPFMTEWEKELAPILRRPIRRVIANPDDIARYVVEFYSLAKSVRGAAKRGDVSGAGASNFEQLVELGRSNRPLDAN
ncbi:GspE/PulE/PilB domain-containing protein, partial [Citrobacter braakii]